VSDPTASDPTIYPPARHLLRDLPFEMADTGPDAARAYLRVVPELFATGRLDLGPLLVVTDVLAGLLVGRVIAPDWMATAQLALHLTKPPAEPGEPGESAELAVPEIVVDAAVRRAGRTTIVVDAALSSSGGAPGSLGDAQLTFVRLPRRDGNLDIADTPVRHGERVSMALADSRMRAPFAQVIGLADTEGSSSTVELAVTPFVQNSFGAVNGGVVASLAATAASRVAAEVLGAEAIALDVTVTYLSQGRVGPLQARATVLRRTGPTVLCRVEVADPGQLDSGQSDHGGTRVLVVAHVHCAAATAV